MDVGSGRFREVRLGRTAQRDVVAILRKSRLSFGPMAARRYETLIGQALHDIGVDPERPGSNAHPDILVAGARIYHLLSSRDNVAGRVVREPRHFVLYRRTGEDNIEVGRVLHDAMDLTKHLPKEYRRVCLG